MDTTTLLTDLKAIQADLEASYKDSDIYTRIAASARAKDVLSTIIIDLEHENNLANLLQSQTNELIEALKEYSHARSDKAVSKENTQLQSLVRNYQAMLNIALAPYIDAHDVDNWIDRVRALDTRTNALLGEN